MTKTKEQALLERLSEPFAGDVVKWRTQGKAFERNGAFVARVVAYVDARIVIDRLNQVCGLNWQKKTTETPKGRVLCSIGITLDDGREVWRDDGAGDTDIEGEKGAISDALKRAAVNFGIGAYLYALPSPMVEVEAYKQGEKVIIKGLTRESKAKLSNLAQRSLDQWSAALKEMDAGGEGGEAPAQKSEQSSPKGAGAASRPAQEPKKEAPKQEPANDAGAHEQRVQTRAAGKTPAKKFPAPTPEAIKADAKAAWREWSRGPFAAIKACSDRGAAIAILTAVNVEMNDALRDCGVDIHAHAMDIINKRWPVDAANTKSPVAVDPPETHTRKAWDAWALKVTKLIEGDGLTRDEAEAIIEANAAHFKACGAALQMDMRSAFDGIVQELFEPTKEKKGRAR